MKTQGTVLTSKCNSKKQPAPLMAHREMPHMRSAWQVRDYLLSTKHRPPPLRDSPWLRGRVFSLQPHYVLMPLMRSAWQSGCVSDRRTKVYFVISNTQWRNLGIHNWDTSHSFSMTRKYHGAQFSPAKVILKKQPALSKSQLNRIALLEIVRALCEC